MPISEASRETDSRGHRDAQERMALLTPYYHWIFSHFTPPCGRCVLDAACGIGNATDLLLSHASRVIACDNDRGSLEELEKRFGNDSRLVVEYLNLDSVEISKLAKHKISSIVCFDFLEHVEDDRHLLRSFHAVSGEGTRLLLKVPAGPHLYCGIDQASGHYRRYARRQLTSVLRESGWDPLFVKPMNVAGTIPYWIKGKLGGRRTNFSRTFTRRRLRLIAKMMPLLRFLDRVVGPPFGLSLVAEAVRKDTRDPNPY